MKYQIVVETSEIMSNQDMVERARIRCAPWSVVDAVCLDGLVPDSHMKIWDQRTQGAKDKMFQDDLSDLL